jgi:hypothetical protein
MSVANVRYALLCVFSKYWYDSTKAHMKPKTPAEGFWEYDPQFEPSIHDPNKLSVI